MARFSKLSSRAAASSSSSNATVPNLGALDKVIYKSKFDLFTSSCRNTIDKLPNIDKKKQKFFLATASKLMADASDQKKGHFSQLANTSIQKIGRMLAKILFLVHRDTSARSAKSNFAIYVKETVKFDENVIHDFGGRLLDLLTDKSMFEIKPSTLLDYVKDFMTTCQIVIPSFPLSGSDESTDWELQNIYQSVSNIVKCYKQSIGGNRKIERRSVTLNDLFDMFMQNPTVYCNQRAVQNISCLILLAVSGLESGSILMVKSAKRSNPKLEEEARNDRIRHSLRSNCVSINYSPVHGLILKVKILFTKKDGSIIDNPHVIRVTEDKENLKITWFMLCWLHSAGCVETESILELLKNIRKGISYELPIIADIPLIVNFNNGKASDSSIPSNMNLVLAHGFEQLNLPSAYYSGQTLRRGFAATSLSKAIANMADDDVVTEEKVDEILKSTGNWEGSVVSLYCHDSKCYSSEFEGFGLRTKKSLSEKLENERPIRKLCKKYNGKIPNNAVVKNEKDETHAAFKKRYGEEWEKMDSCNCATHDDTINVDLKRYRKILKLKSKNYYLCLSQFNHLPIFDEND